MTTTPILAMPNFESMFEVHIDASDYEIGVVLVQEGRPLDYLRTTETGMVSLFKRNACRSRSSATMEALLIGVKIQDYNWSTTTETSP